jgi:hypothetical protein
LSEAHKTTTGQVGRIETNHLAGMEARQLPDAPRALSL